jgi:pyruvate formate lyase activating enzyme
LASPSVAAEYWHRLDDGRIQCDLCPRACRLRDGQRGFCFVRAREGEEMVLPGYGRSSGICVDPIEKKPLHHFLPGSAVLSFGTIGCNLNCRFCQNWSISKSDRLEHLTETAAPEEIAAVAERLGCAGVAFTYNEPAVFLEYALATAEACRAHGLATVAVSAGYLCERPRRDLFAHLDAANIDLKALDDDFYRRYCGGRLQPVLETLEYAAKETDVWLEVTNLVIPGLNDSDGDVDRLSAWMVDRLGRDVPLHLSAFHPDHRLLDRPPTPLETLRRARTIALENGLRHVYTGNVRDPEGATTFCPSCARPVIERRGYRIESYRLDREGLCEHCGEPIAGFFRFSDQG